MKASSKARGLSQEAFSDVSSRTYLSSLERGLKSPTLNKIEELCEVMKARLIKEFGLVRRLHHLFKTKRDDAGRSEDDHRQDDGFIHGGLSISATAFKRTECIPSTRTA